MIFAKIVNAFGGKPHPAQVYKNGALSVSPVAAPPFEYEGGMRIYREYLTDDGLTADGTNNDMRILGNVTPTDFYVSAQQENDLYITTLSFEIADAGATLNSFGNITALTTGCVLSYEDEMGSVTIHDALQSNWDFVRLSGGNPAFGNGASAFRANNVSGTSEGFIPMLDFRQVFGFQWGLRLRAGSTQKINLLVQDVTSTVDTFDCIAYGFTRSPD